MRIETHDGLTNPQVIRATRLVVKDSHGQPVFVVLEQGPDRFLTFKASDPDFQSALAQFGIRQTAVVTVVDVKPGEFQIGE